MHWRWLLPFPIAAFLCGEAVDAPHWKEEIPKQSAACPGYAAARERFLLAYAYSREEPKRARALVEEVNALTEGCDHAGLLRARAAALLKRD